MFVERSEIPCPHAEYTRVFHSARSALLAKDDWALRVLQKIIHNSLDDAVREAMLGAFLDAVYGHPLRSQTHSCRLHGRQDCTLVRGVPLAVIRGR